jgi:uncharacterized protein involved in outer membrane biogenesis
LDYAGNVPRLFGHVDADALPLPLPAIASEVPLPFGVLRGWQGELQLGIGQLTVSGGPVLRDASATLSVANEALRIDRFAAKLERGSASGSLSIDTTANPPLLSLRGTLSDVVISGPLTDSVFDLHAGQVDADTQLDASGYSPSALVSTLRGRLALTVNDGTVSGFDLPRLKSAVESADPKVAEAMANDALRSGLTSFDRLELAADIAHGDLTIDRGVLTSTDGEAHVSGNMNLMNQTLDAEITLRPALPSPPEVTLHLTGPAVQPNRTPELAGLARWMAELVR